MANLIGHLQEGLIHEDKFSLNVCVIHAEKYVWFTFEFNSILTCIAYYTVWYT